MSSVTLICFNHYIITDIFFGAGDIFLLSGRQVCEGSQYLLLKKLTKVGPKKLSGIQAGSRNILLACAFIEKA